MTDTYIPMPDDPTKAFVLALAKREACGEDDSLVTQKAKRVLRAYAASEPSPYVVELEAIAREA